MRHSKDKSTPRKRLLSLLLSSLFGLFAANAVLEITSGIQREKYSTDPLKALELEARHSKVPHDRRTKLEVVRDLRTQGHPAWPSAYTHHLLEALTDEQKQTGRFLIPLGFIPTATYVLCNELGQWSIFKTDRYGFHNNDDQAAWPEQKVDDRPVVLLGDSMVEGQCVQEGQDIASQLRRRQIRAISLGSGGSGPLRELAILKEYALHVRPKAIFWFFFAGNDLDDAVTEYADLFLRQYLQDGFTQDLIHRQPEIDRVWKDFLQEAVKQQEQVEGQQPRNPGRTSRPLINRISPYLTMYPIRKLLSLNAGRFRQKHGQELLAAALRQAKKISAANGVPFIVVYLPSREGSSRAEQAIRSQVKALTASLHIPIIDIFETFSERADFLEFFPQAAVFGHYQPSGYQAVAARIASYLNE
jgi:hypothetical protein